MRRLLLFCSLIACAHRAPPADPLAWIELESEHFTLRTDLAGPQAREVVAQLELVRAALIGVSSWRRPTPLPGRLQVIDLATKKELEEFAAEGIEGFVSADAFGERIMVMSAEQAPEEQTVLKHELAHVISNEALVRNPRWVAEGIACYLETMRFDRAAHRVFVGEPSRDRVAYLRRFPVTDFGPVFAMGSEAVSLGPEAGFAYESAAWLLVHYLASARATRFESFLSRLGRGEDPKKAFAAEFPDLAGAKLREEIERYWKEGKGVAYAIAEPEIDGSAALRSVSRAEVHALRADLLRISPGYPRTPERAARQAAELQLALQDDPGNPLALELTDAAEAEAATRAHPDDWRAWVLAADRNDDDPSAIARAARLAPDNAGVLSRLAWADWKAGHHKKAIDHARRANELAPGRSVHLDTLASLLAMAGKCDEAIPTEQRAIEVLPDTAPAGTADDLRARLTNMETKCGRTPSHVDLAQTDYDVAPVRKSCGEPPRLARAPRGRITAEYTVREDGSVGEISMSGNATSEVLRAFKAFVKSCSYQPATRAGKPIAARIKQDLSVGKR